MEDDDKPKPEPPAQPEQDPSSSDDGLRIPTQTRPELLNPQTEGLDRIPEIKEKKK